MSYWTDGLTVEFEAIVTCVVWPDTECKMRPTYLGRNKEMFDADLYAIYKALGVGLWGGRLERGLIGQRTESP